MSFLKSTYGLIKFAVQEIKRQIELAKYDRWNKVEYLRKSGAQIGEDCNIHPLSLGTEPYLVKIGNHVTVAGGVTFITHDGGAWVLREQIPDIQVFGPIIIEDNCVIGQAAILCPNIRIGKNSIVGAGSVVISNVPENTVVMGVPARPIGSVEKYKEKCIAKWQEQRPPDIVIEPDRNWWNSKHYNENREKLKRHLIDLFWN
jgi:acetyltransferase-like isoleucine patch superfamily enzyme